MFVNFFFVFQRLCDLQFDTYPIIASTIDDSPGARKHYFINDIIHTKSKPSRQSVTRLKQELSTLSTALPPGIFVRIDESRMDVIQACIIGPEETPYENGLFMFDILLPPDYPFSPPKCQSMTTGNNTFRFNPNLYADGKVCLSLLGTWSGPK